MSLLLLLNSLNWGTAVVVEQFGFSPSFESADDILPTMALATDRVTFTALEGNLYDTNRVYDVNENYWDGKDQGVIPSFISADDITPSLEIRN